MNDFTFWRSVSSQVAACMSSIDVHTGVFTNVLMVCTFMFMLAIFWSKMNKDPININNDDTQYEAIIAHHSKYMKGSDTHIDSLSFL